MTLDEIANELVAVVLFIEQEHEKDDVRWFAGRARERDGRLEIERGTDQPFRLPIEALDDIRLASEKHREVFSGCRFILPLTIPQMPEEGVEGAEFTGLRVDS